MSCIDNDLDEDKWCVDDLAETGGMVKQSIKLDSGADSSFMNEEALPGLATKESKDKGKTWYSATGGKIKDAGTSRLPFVTDEGHKSGWTFKRGRGIRRNL